MKARLNPNILLLLPLLEHAGVSAFASNSQMGATGIPRFSLPTCSQLFSSQQTTPPSSDGLGDDEVSKLIGRRNKIKRKKKEDLEVPQTDEPVVDLDLDRLPEFKTERPVRRANPSQSDDDENDKDGKSKKKEDLPIVDFMADYEDENDWHIPNRIGITTQAWGDERLGFVNSNKKLSKRMLQAGKFLSGDLQLAYNQLLEGGILLFETSPSYGAANRPKALSAEDILKRCIQEGTEAGLPDAMIATDPGTSAWRKPTGMANGLGDSCDRMGVPILELFQVPKPNLFPGFQTAKELASAIEEGQCSQVGVKGLTSASSLRRLQNRLDNLDCVLTSNAFEFSLTNQKNLKMINACKDLGIVPLIANPLDGGLAGGVFTATNPTGGVAGGAVKFDFKILDKLQPLHSVQDTLTDRVRTRVVRDKRNIQSRFKGKFGPPPSINTDITTTQIAIHYVIAKGGVPLVPVNTPAEAADVLGCLGWSLADEEVAMLDSAVMLCK